MKNKQKRKTKQPKRRTRKPRKRLGVTSGENIMSTRVIQPSAPIRGAVKMKFVESVCGNWNPFCIESIGAKIPDVSSAKTLTACVRILQNIDTDGSGKAYYGFFANLVNYGGVATLTGDTITAYTNLGSVPFYASYLANCSRYRVVSFGVKFVPTASFFNAAGALIATEADDLVAIGGVINSVNNTPTTFVRSVVGEPLIWVSRPTDIEYTDFIAVSAATHGVTRTLVTLGVTGAPFSTTVGVAEIIMNVELIPIPNTVGGLFPTAAAPSNPLIMNMAANVSQKVPSFFSGSAESFTALVEKEVHSLATTALSAGGSYLRSSVMGALMAP